MSHLHSTSNQLLKTSYVQRLTKLVPNLLYWFQSKQTQLEQFHRINKQILTNLELFSKLTTKYLQYLLKFLQDEKTSARKLTQMKENHSFLKILQKQKQKKTSQEDQKAISDLNEWNPTLLKFFDGLSESTIQQRNMLKKFYHSLQQLIDQFEKIQQNYKAFLKKHFKIINKKHEEIEENSKAQKKILYKYYDDHKKYTKDPTSTISDVKLVENHTYKQIDLLVQRAEQIRKFIEQLIQYETAINNTFKQRFAIFLSGEQSVFSLTTHMMALPKLIERIDNEQVAIKTRYFQKHIVSEATLAKIKAYSGFIEADALVSVNKYLSISVPIMISLFCIEKTIKQFIDHVVFRQWDLELSEGWIIESWTKCKGYITLDNYFILFGDNAKPLRVINTKNTKLESHQQNVVFLNESHKGIFGTSSQQYKIKFGSQNHLEQFQLYLDNKIS